MLCWKNEKRSNLHLHTGQVLPQDHDSDGLFVPTQGVHLGAVQL